VYIEPDNVWGDGEIVILVNADTASAAEIFAYFMGKLENVTIMGMTKSTGSAMMSNSYGLRRFELSFPVMLILDENSDVLIDSDISGISNMPLDVRIPMDEEAFTSIFEENIDYVLDYAVKYMENQ
nr:S41 family peptidase [Lachnospiraceae bacterium]